MPRFRTFLPRLSNNPTVSGTGDIVMTPDAFEFAEAWLTLLGTRANRMVLGARLFEGAQDHATWLAQRQDTMPSMHIGQGGLSPNRRVRLTGYKLAEWYGVGNVVESCSRSWDEDIARIAQHLAAHEGHRQHLMGIGWYSEHIVYGVGSAWEPSGSRYFVVWCCPIEDAQ